jgi:GTP-binding protein
MLPVVALVGRPNVGKSTLFNRLTGTRDAIVADVPGVTRDRQYGFGTLGPVPYVVVDTGGLVEHAAGLDAQMQRQAERAIAEADRIVLVVDARSGLTRQDEFVARALRRAGKPVVIAVNKAEGLEPGFAAADFHALGLGAPQAIAASHGDGCEALMERVLEGFDAAADEQAERDGSIRIAVIGRPNVGKSTLINRLIGEERVIASDVPGTTRDSILVPFERDGRRFVLIDTAGVRRRAKIDDAVERASVARTLQAIADAHVVVFVVDAHDTIGEQDASVLGLALQRGRALLIAVNKWDGIPMDQRDEIRRQLEVRLDFVPFAPVHFISARHGTGVGDIAADAIRAYDAAMREMTTPQLTRSLESALQAHQPPLVRGRRIKLRYAHQGGRNPPRIVIHGNQTAHVPDAYTRYLANVFRRDFDLYATPVSVEYRTDANPYDRRRKAEHAARVTAEGGRSGAARRRRAPRRAPPRG